MSLWEDIKNDIESATGVAADIEQQGSVGGGCINQAARIRYGNTRYFVKLNTASGYDMFAAEAQGLTELRESKTLKIPEPLCVGSNARSAWLVMENLSLGGQGSDALLGEKLADMHRVTRDAFGWDIDNTIGSTPQENAWLDDWIDFWRVRRLRFQLDLAARQGAGHGLLSKVERLIDEFPALFDGYRPLASLLHGDLWSGNYAFTSTNEPAIFDPAVYYGDREADIAMTELFGGFGRDFYAAYNNAWSLDAGYPVRKTLYNLYHILNHFNLFGGGYASQAQRMTESLLSELR
ncbi:MAG: fructosamine kinase family protein [Gammaproteobacteria bacterium]|nr:fructosamine kinase family protein [Gammaproteobacteria bacterium]